MFVETREPPTRHHPSHIPTTTSTTPYGSYSQKPGPSGGGWGRLPRSKELMCVVRKLRTHRWPPKAGGGLVERLAKGPPRELVPRPPRFTEPFRPLEQLVGNQDRGLADLRCFCHAVLVVDRWLPVARGVLTTGLVASQEVHRRLDGGHLSDKPCPPKSRRRLEEGRLSDQPFR